MATLEWDFRVTNANVVERALAGIERRVVVHNQRVARSLGQTTKTPSSRTLQAARGVGPEVAAAEKVAQAKIRAEAKVDAFIRRAEAKRARDAERAAAKAEREAIQSARRIVAAEERGRKKAERDWKKAEKAAQAAQVRTARSIGSSATGAIGGVGRLAGAALSIGGGFAVAGAIENQMSEEAQASKLANQAQVPGEKKQILADARGVRGFTGSEALAGMSAFVTKTGDLKTARDLIGSLGDLALATDTDLGDLGATAGQVFNVLKGQIKDPAERMKQLKDIMGTLAQQGSMGAVEMNNLATIFGKLGSATSRFEGGAPALMKQMGALAQLAVQGGGASSPEEAATAVARLSTDIVTNRKKFAALPGGGVTVQSATDPSKLRDASAIMIDVLEKTKGDITQVSGLFGGESIKVFEGLKKLYTDAEGVEKGSGIKALKAGLGEFTGASTSAESIKARTDSRFQDSDIQFKEAMKKFNMEVGSRLLPAITELIPKFVDFIPQITRASEAMAGLAGYLMSNPLRGIGMVISAAISKDIAAAAIGKAMTEGIGLQFSKAIAPIAIATAAFTIGTGIIDIAFNAKDEAQKENIRRDVETANITGKARSELSSTGSLSDETKKALQKRLEEATSTANAPMPSFTDLINPFSSGPGLGYAVSVKEQGDRKVQEIKAASEIKMLQMEAAMAQKRAAEAIENAAKNLNGVPPNRGNSPSPIKGKA